MIRTSLANADERDFQAITSTGTSPARNILFTTLPLSAVAFLVIYGVSRSLWIAAPIAAALMAGSIVSNVRFFRKVADRRTEQRSGKSAVEIIDVEALRVFDIEPLGSHGPAFVFFAADGKALQHLLTALGETGDEATQTVLLEELANSVRTRGRLTMPEAWPNIYQRLAKSRNETIRRHAQFITVKFGDTTLAAKDAEQLIAKVKADKTVAFAAATQ